MLIEKLRMKDKKYSPGAINPLIGRFIRSITAHYDVVTYDENGKENIAYVLTNEKPAILITFYLSGVIGVVDFISDKMHYFKKYSGSTRNSIFDILGLHELKAA